MSSDMRDLRDEMARRLGGYEYNTIWLEAVVEQGRSVDADDVNEVSEFVEEQVQVWAESMGTRPEIRRRDVFCIPGTDRPMEEEFFGVSAENRIHCFIRVDTNQLPTQQADGLKTNIATAFQGENPLQDRPPDAAVGRGFSTFNILDEKVVAEAAPELVGPAREDAEIL